MDVGVATLLVKRILALDEVGRVAYLTLGVITCVGHANCVDFASAEVIVAKFAAALDQSRHERTMASEACPGGVLTEPSIALVDPLILYCLYDLSDFLFGAAVLLDSALYTIFGVRKCR